jgi:type IV fimbrial biogenesis protein FimT
MLSILRMRSTADGRHKYNTAFTLIELVIVLAIMGLVAVMTVPGFVGMMRGRHLTSAANLVHATLNEAKNTAVTQRKPYGLVLDTLQSGMKIYESGDTTNPIQGKAVFLPQVVNFDTADAAWNVPNDKPEGSPDTYPEIVFRPDGSLDASTSPVIVIVDRQGEHMYIRVVRNTGQPIME